MNPKVSCIVPVYNLESCVEHCLQSFLWQTYENWEAILVDDGSRDNSGEIIRKYAEKDGRFRYVRKENAGVAAARNTGLSLAEGEYVSFVDGDDYLHPQALEILVQSAEKTSADIVACSYAKTYQYLTKPENLPSVPEPEMLDYSAFSDVHGDTMIAKMSCAKIYKSSIAKTKQFPTDTSYSEDHIYNIRLMSTPLKISYIHLPLYYYVQRESSASHVVFSEKHMQRVPAFANLCEEIRDCEDSFLRGYAMRHLFLSVFQIRMSAVGTPLKKKAYKLCRQCGKKWIGPWLRNPSNGWSLRLGFTAFFYCAKLYEWVRIRQDPSMKEYLAEKRKKK